jgi:hypothetical protein
MTAESNGAHPICCNFCANISRRFIRWRELINSRKRSVIKHKKPVNKRLFLLAIDLGGRKNSWEPTIPQQ